MEQREWEERKTILKAKKSHSAYIASEERIEGDKAIITFSNIVGKTFEVHVDKDDLVMRSAMNQKAIGVNY